MKIVLATRNSGKTREVRRLVKTLAPETPLEVTDLNCLEGPYESPEENGQTFMENAEIKAAGAWKRVAGEGVLVIGEDSGLEVDFLGGKPGVMSHRFSGPDATDDENNAALLRALEGVPWDRRTARYRCAMVLVGPGGVMGRSEGTVEGYILTAPRGTGGFGYDPLFYCPELGKGFGECTPEEKDRVSHRGRALKELIPVIRRVCRS